MRCYEENIDERKFRYISNAVFIYKIFQFRKFRKNRANLNWQS